MPNSWFRFKRFLIRQDLTAMKVGTDAVLLGAWAGTSQGKSQKAEGKSQFMLDVGTGTGLVALMLAQRFEHAHVTGLEIDAEASVQASENMRISPWPDRVKAEQADFRTWDPQVGISFDLIACNPPYFNMSLKNPDKRRSMARHDDDLPLAFLIGKSAGMLAPAGRLALVLPVVRVEEAMDQASSSGLFLCRRLNVRGNPQAPVKRVLLEWGKVSAEPETGELILESSRGVRSEEYAALTGQFYL